MCGLVGLLNLKPGPPIEAAALRHMLALIRHRGPDQFGLYLDDQIGLGHARLSIIDLTTGQQPVTNEDESLWIVFNGEIFNYVELRPGLEARGHRFTTTTDTEVILHLYEELGPGCLDQLNGQFAMAIWDARQQTLFLARDRLGVRPLYYTEADGCLIFASEIKAILADRRVQPEIDPLSLDQIFTYWSPLSPRTIFRHIREVPPGHFLLAQAGHLSLKRYWQVAFPPADPRPPALTRADVTAYLSEFRRMLVDATTIRLRADVPVGAYLSGGLDSSTTAAIIRRYTGNQLDTFSIAFEEPAFDESNYQQQMARYLGTDHQVVRATPTDIGQVFPEVIWHTEVPLLRTAPVPLFLLSKLVRARGYKVVLTGEGADEFLAGYNIFKEAAIRRFWARQPHSTLRPRLLQRLYPYISTLTQSGESYLTAFFRPGLTELASPFYSHAVRWRNTSRTKRFFSEALQAAISTEAGLACNGSGLPEPPYPADFAGWHPLHQAQYLEITIFLAQYLLSSQGDRVAAAHAVEGRFPFLDVRLVEFCNRLPPALKLRGLTEKYLLKKLAQEWLPAEIWQRPKRPYRAPIQRSFFNDSRPAYVAELLSPEQLAATGLFKPAAVGQLVQKIERGGPISETDEMALAGILSSQLLHHQFITDFRRPIPLTDADDIKVCDRQRLADGGHHAF